MIKKRNWWLISFAIGMFGGYVPVHIAVYHATSANYGIATPAGIFAGIVVLLLTRITISLTTAEAGVSVSPKPHRVQAGQASGDAQM